MEHREVTGSWRGRLIDIRGYEGEVTLRLEGDGESVRGTASVSIGGTHASTIRRLELRGELREDQLRLSGAVPGDLGVEIAVDATLFEMPIGGTGLRGTYEVTAKQWSPMRAGVLTAARGLRPASTEISARAPEEMAS